MIIYSKGSPQTSLTDEDIKEAIDAVFEYVGGGKSILLIPPDITRIHSQAGKITKYIYDYNPSKIKAILPALGTHKMMEPSEIEKMFGNIPLSLFKVHNWRVDCKEVGSISSEYIENISEGKVDFPIKISFNKYLFENNFDYIISISQVVPHEVAGMAGFTKNITVGLGGEENINKTHFLGAVYGMEKIMGRLDTPVRKVIDYAFKNFLSGLNFIHIITVIGSDDNGEMKMRGLFIGDDEESYKNAALLSKEINITFLEKPLKKVVVYLDPIEYKSTWLGNKSIYRTRMAIADEGELIVLAPGVKMFGEDKEIDTLIRKIGYKGTKTIMSILKKDPYLQNNLSAIAHLIHGSSEGRFTITYCTELLDKSEIENVGFKYFPFKEMIKKYNPSHLIEGYNKINGEEIFFISKPGSGLWVWRNKFI